MPEAQARQLRPESNRRRGGCPAVCSRLAASALCPRGGIGRRARTQNRVPQGVSVRVGPGAPASQAIPGMATLGVTMRHLAGILMLVKMAPWTRAQANEVDSLSPDMEALQVKRVRLLASLTLMAGVGLLLGAAIRAAGRGRVFPAGDRGAGRRHRAGADAGMVRAARRAVEAVLRCFACWCSWRSPFSRWPRS